MSCQEYQFIRNPITANEASYLWGHYTKVIDIPFFQNTSYGLFVIIKILKQRNTVKTKAWFTF